MSRTRSVECCGVDAEDPPVSTCPTCRTRGQVVLSTVKAVLTEYLLRRLELTDYRFCPEATCPTVYFAVRGRGVFDRGDIRVPIWQT